MLSLIHVKIVTTDGLVSPVLIVPAARIWPWVTRFSLFLAHIQGLHHRAMPAAVTRLGMFKMNLASSDLNTARWELQKMFASSGAGCSVRHLE